MKTTVQPKAAGRTRTLILCCLINLCVGSLYAWSVFAGSMYTYLTSAAKTPPGAGASGNYTRAFLAGILFSVVGIVLILVYRKKYKQGRTQE